MIRIPRIRIFLPDPDPTFFLWILAPDPKGVRFGSFVEPDPEFLAEAGASEKASAQAPQSSDNSWKIESHFDNLYTN